MEALQIIEDELTAQEHIWVEGLKKFTDKAIPKGWKRSPSDDYIKVLPVSNVLQVEVLSPSGNKHWIRIGEHGNIFFSPVRMNCF